MRADRVVVVEYHSFGLFRKKNKHLKLVKPHQPQDLIEF